MDHWLLVRKIATRQSFKCTFTNRILTFPGDETRNIKKIQSTCRLGWRIPISPLISSCAWLHQPMLEGCKEENLHRFQEIVSRTWKTLLLRSETELEAYASRDMCYHSRDTSAWHLRVTALKYWLPDINLRSEPIVEVGRWLDSSLVPEGWFV